MTLRVWHLCSNRWNSAITEYALRATQALKANGADAILSAKPGSPCEKRALAYGIAGRSFAFKFSEVLALRREVKGLKPDLIVTYGGPETFLARFLGVPVVRFRGQDSDLHSPLKPFSLRLNLSHCAAILTPAEAVANRFQAIFSSLPLKAITLGLDDKLFFPREKKDERVTLLIVGRLDPVKGHREFFHTYAELLKDREVQALRPRLDIIGLSSNLSSQELHDYAKGLGLILGEDYRIFDERVENLAEIMSSAALGIVPSLGSEVIGRVSEEFLLCGTPVLIADVGSLRELLKYEDFGSILSLDSLKTWLLRSNDEDFSHKLSRSQKAKKHFSLESMGKELSLFFDSFLTKKKR